MKSFLTDAPMHYMPKGLFEYLLIVSPDKEVYNKVMEEKQCFSRNYNQPIAIKTKPHITVSNFLAWDSMEETIVRWLQRIIKEQKCFPVTLNNYSGFPAHTVFLRVQEPAPFKELAISVKAIAPYIKESNCPPAKFISNPHVSIARRLPSAVYEDAMRDYAEKDFHASFNVTELLLLKRHHQYDVCKETAVFRLQPNEYNN